MCENVSENIKYYINATYRCKMLAAGTVTDAFTNVIAANHPTLPWGCYYPLAQMEKQRLRKGE